ncbi:MAG: peptidoglycan DD-metalloendopeptidase family protein [bacterium]|nr:peptidoglycan DD-metalloendopeptidase family protein [bacterium]
MKSSRHLFNTLLIVLLFASFVYAEEDFDYKIKENETKLSDIKRQLQLIKTKKDSLKAEETQTLLTLNRMDEEIYLTDLLIKQLEKRNNLLALKVDTLSKEISSLEADLSKRREILKARVRDIYKKGKISTFELVFTATSFADLSQRVKYMSVMAKQDKRLYDKVKKIQSLLTQRVRDIKTSREELDKVKGEVEAEKTKLQSDIDGKKKFLKQLSSEQQKQTNIESELKKSEESLQYLINKLRVAQKKIDKKRDVKEGSHYFDKNKGKVIWPASGKIISGFGNVRHPKYQTKTLNNGIDILVAIGDPIYAVYDGDVIYADKFLGYGNVIMIDHGNGYYTLYSHLSSVDVVINQPVLMGEVIGKGGDTGSLSGPMLHFEVRKDGKPLNPANYLKKK